MASDKGIPDELPLAEAYFVLDTRRTDIDRQIVGLAADDHTREKLWQDLESVLEKLREVIGKLTRSAAVDVAELKNKADILSALLRSEEAGGGPIITEPERTALALSLTEDIVRILRG